MKKSQNIILSTALFVAITSCSNNKPKDEWTDGKDINGHTHDTTVYQNGQYHNYRYYGGGWFLLTNGLINRGYAPASSAEISNPSFSPRSASGSVRTGGFGESGHGAGAGE